MNEHDLWTLIQIITCLFTLGSQVVVLISLRKTQRWIEWTRDWISRANARLKELEDWIEK